MATSIAPVERWNDRASDPNDPMALVARADVLRASWRPPIADRNDFLAERCRDRRVLDVGCVAHDVARMESDQWLHRRLAAVAATCIGLDVLEEGAAAMRERGFEVIVHDASTGLGPLEAIGPFDVIVAGELLEHLESLGMLFDMAEHLLTSDGQLILTTPNPWAPHRVRAGQRGVVWENVDHVVLAFPSGIAELAERHGLVLSEAATTRQPDLVPKDHLLRRLRRRARGAQWTNVGVTTFGERRERRVAAAPLLEAVQRVMRSKHRFVGETFVYVVRRSAHTARSTPGQALPSA